MDKLFVLSAVGATLVILFLDQPERRPGNLAPIQVITSLGTWALLFANLAAIVVGIRTGAWPLVSIAALTFVTAVVIYAEAPIRASRQQRPIPSFVREIVEELAELTAGTQRLGFRSVAAEMAPEGGSGIGVRIQRRTLVVRFQPKVVAWLRQQERTPSIRSFLRFSILHEIGHILNGDHRTYRFARAVLLAQTWWLAAPLAALAATVMAGDPAQARMITAALAMILEVVLVQCAVARRFIAEREEYADWRAMQTIGSSDVTSLLGGGESSEAPAGDLPVATELEQLLNALRSVRQSRRLPAVIEMLAVLLWPEGRIDARIEALRNRDTRRRRPILWGLLTGVQGAFLGVALLAVVLSLPLYAWTEEALVNVAILLNAWIAGPAAAYCLLLVSPARVSIEKQELAPVRAKTAFAFYGGSATAIVTLRYALTLPTHLVFLSWIAQAAVLAILAVAVGGALWIAPMASRGGGGGYLEHVPRAWWVMAAPLLAGFLGVMIPLCVVSCQLAGLGGLWDGMWVSVMLFAFGAFVMFTACARSTSAFLRAISPFGSLDTPTPVIGVRIFWSDVHVDLARAPLVKAMAIAFVAETAGLLSLTAAGTWLLRFLVTIVGRPASFGIVFFGGMLFFLTILIIPDRYGAFGTPSRGLLDTNRLVFLLRLLEAAEQANPDAAERLRRALSSWIREEDLPRPILPDEQALWPLLPLWTLIRVAQRTDPSTVSAWRDTIEAALGRVVRAGKVSANDREPPSLFYSSLATAIAAAAGADPPRLREMLDPIEVLLEDRLRNGTTTFVSDVVLALQLLRGNGRRGPERELIEAFAQRCALLSQPLIRQSLVELEELSGLLADEAMRRRLVFVVRSRLWELLQRNARKDVVPLLDCYIAGIRLGEEASPLFQAAARIINEIASQTAQELTTLNAGTERARQAAPKRRAA